MPLKISECNWNYSNRFCNLPKRKKRKKKSERTGVADNMNRTDGIILELSELTIIGFIVSRLLGLCLVKSFFIEGSTKPSWKSSSRFPSISNSQQLHGRSSPLFFHCSGQERPSSSRTPRRSLQVCSSTQLTFSFHFCYMFLFLNSS